MRARAQMGLGWGPSDATCRGIHAMQYAINFVCIDSMQLDLGGFMCDWAATHSHYEDKNGRFRACVIRPTSLLRGEIYISHIRDRGNTQLRGGKPW